MHQRRTAVRGSLFAWTMAALLGFSGNSLLTRVAVADGGIDPATFMAVRIVSGALTLVAIAGWRPAAAGGSWRSGLALAAYAAGFTYAYLRIGAGAGALLLFGSVQATMIGWGLVRGERPGRAQWLGLAIAITGLLMLTAPGLSAPDPTGATLMSAAGVAWGIYSLRGRGATSPVADNAGNFVRATPLVLAAVAALAAGVRVTPAGVLLAVASGSVTSGLAYSAWYVAVPRLGAWRAAIVQLAVPAITAAAAAVLLAEPVTFRLAASALAILGGVALSVAGSRRR